MDVSCAGEREIGDKIIDVFWSSERGIPTHQLSQFERASTATHGIHHPGIPKELGSDHQGARWEDNSF